SAASSTQTSGRSRATVATRAPASSESATTAKPAAASARRTAVLTTPFRAAMTIRLCMAGSLRRSAPQPPPARCQSPFCVCSRGEDAVIFRTRGTPQVEFSILGPVEAANGDGALPLGGPRQRALLACLLVHANRVVAADSLVEE